MLENPSWEEEACLRAKHDILRKELLRALEVFPSLIVKTWARTSILEISLIETGKNWATPWSVVQYSVIWNYNLFEGRDHISYLPLDAQVQE